MIGFVGFGHVGKALAERMYQAGFAEMSFYDPYVVLNNHLMWATAFMVQMDTIEALVQACDTVFLTVPDDRVEDVALTIAATCPNLVGKDFVHTAGALNTDSLMSLKGCGASVGSMHPLLAFNNHEISVKSLKNAYFVVEKGHESAGLMAIVRRLGNPILEVPSEKKPLYHAGACVVSNYITVVLDYGLEMIRSATGSTREQALEAAWPLIESALDNIRILGSHRALTGPLKRQDIKTVKAHLAQLKDHDDGAFYNQLVAATYCYMQKYHYEHALLDGEWGRKDD